MSVEVSVSPLTDQAETALTRREDAEEAAGVSIDIMETEWRETMRGRLCMVFETKD